MSNPLLLGFIVDFEKFIKHNLAKMALVELIEKKLLPDDKAYYYKEDVVEVPNRATEIVSPVLTSHCLDIANMGRAMERTVYVLGGEILEDYRRHIFILSDRYASYNQQTCRRAIRLDERDGFNSTFIFCDFSDTPNKFIDLPNTLYWHFPVADNFKPKIIEFIKTLNEN